MFTTMPGVETVEIVTAISRLPVARASDQAVHDKAEEALAPGGEGRCLLGGVEDLVRDVDHLIDTVGGPHGYRFLPTVRPGGTISPVFYGEYHDDQAAERGITFPAGRVHSDGAQMGELARLIDEGRLRVGIDSVFALPDAARAHERAERGHIQGKIVLRVTED